MKEFISVPFIINKSLDVVPDENGDYIFEVEASNENLDLQNQRTQQKALRDCKKYFLSNGVISCEHQHRIIDADGNEIIDNSQIIGEPIAVTFDGTKTFVKGKLYKNIKAAQDFINLLKAHSSRVKASIGGLKPTIIENPDGTQTITSFLWDDLALTCEPVNATVSPARFAKSLSNVEFCKALDSVNGKALITEDLEKPATNILSEKNKIEINQIASKEDELTDIIKDLVMAMNNEEVTSKRDVFNFCTDRGLSVSEASEIYEELCNQEDYMKAFAEKFGIIMKSLKGSKTDDSVKKSENENDDEELNFNLDEDFVLDDDKNGNDGNDNGNDDDDDEKKKKAVKKSLDNNDDFVEITDLLKSIDNRMEQTDEEIKVLQKSLISLAEVVKAGFATPQVRKSVMAKTNIDTNVATEKPTQEDLEAFKVVLCKAKSAGAINLRKSVHLETVFQKSMRGVAMTSSDEKEVRDLYEKYHA